MSLEENKNLVRRFYEAINREDFDALDELCHKDFVFYSQVDKPIPGIQGFIDSEKQAFAAFESFKFPLEIMVAEGDRVAAFLTIEAKNQQRATMGAEARGKNVRISLFALLTIKDGKISEKRAHFDIADIRRQLA